MGEEMILLDSVLAAKKKCEEEEETVACLKHLQEHIVIPDFSEPGGYGAFPLLFFYLFISL